MSVLRILIIKEWFRHFFYSFFVLFLLVTTASLISGFLRGSVTSLEVIYNYFLEIPSFITRILPVSCLATSIFSIHKFKNRNEIVAMFASGLTRRKFISTIFLCSFFVALLQFVNGSFVNPYVLSRRNTLIENPQSKFRNLQGEGLKSKTVGSGRVWYKGQEYYVAFPIYQRLEKKLFNLNIYYFSSNSSLIRRISTNIATFNEETEQWIGEKVTELNRIDEKNIFPTVTRSENASLPLEERPSDFDQIESDISILNIFKLKDYIDRLKQTDININDFMVIYLDKYSSSVVCIIFALLASSGIFSPNRRGSSLGKNLFFIFVFTIIYWVVSYYALELGRSSKIDAYVACFAVPVFFLLFLATFFFKNRRITSA